MTGLPAPQGTSAAPLTPPRESGAAAFDGFSSPLCARPMVSTAACALSPFPVPRSPFPSPSNPQSTIPPPSPFPAPRHTRRSLPPFVSSPDSRSMVRLTVVSILI
jgi:hypothetical protein